MDFLEHKIPAGASLVIVRNGAVVGATTIAGMKCAPTTDPVGRRKAHRSPQGEIVDMEEYYHGERR